MKLSTVAVGLAALLPFAAAQTVPYATGAEAVDAEILQYALTLEHLEAAFYKEALEKFSDADFQALGYSAFVRQRLTQVAAHEATHVTVLSSVLEAAGQTPTAACTYNFPYADIPGFLALSSILEGVGVSAYLYKSQFINNKDYLVAAASILAVEARHAALITSFSGNDGVPSAFDTPLTGSEVFSLATPFIVSCPEGNPALPFKAFPTLTATVSGTPKSGSTVAFTFESKQKGDVYIHFFNGLSDIAVKLVDGKATIPADLTGTVYAVASTGKDRPNDDTTVAGPAIITLPNPDSTYEKKAKRAIKFSK